MKKYYITKISTQLSLKYKKKAFTINFIENSFLKKNTSKINVKTLKQFSYNDIAH